MAQVSGPDGMPGRRRAHRRPFEESATLLGAPPADDAAEESAGRSPADEDIARVIGGAHSQSRPAARPATRAPALSPGPVILPPGERPAARPPGARRADRPTLVGPDPNASAGGRRVATPPEPATGHRRPEAQPEIRSDSPPEPASAIAPPPVVGPSARAGSEPLRTSTPPPEPGALRVPAAPARSRERTRGWLGERATAAPAPVSAPVLPGAAPENAPEEAPAQAPAPEPAATARRVTADRPAVPARPPGPLPARARLYQGSVAIWTLAIVLGVTGILASRAVHDVPAAARLACAGVVAVALALGLAVRTGGRPWWATGLCATLVAAACVSGSHTLLAGASVGTGVMAATLAVMATTPAARFAIAIREAIVATAIAAAGAVGVIGFGPHARPEVAVDRIGYVVLGLSLAGAFALVYRLGAGLHGLGRRGYAVAGGAVVMLALALAYSEAFAQWGSRDLIRSLDDVRDALRSSLGAVPHPMAALLGYPALLWGVFMRARRRQGWWVTAFGVAATAPTATRLVATDLDLRTVLLGMLYSLVVGGVIGYLVIRVEQALTGTHGRRARRDEEAVAHRPEPGRTHPLH